MPIAYLPLTDLVRGAVTDINPASSITEYDWTTEISSTIALPSGFGQGTAIYRVYHESMLITPSDGSKAPTTLYLYVIKADQSSYSMLGPFPYGQWTDVEICDYYKIIASPNTSGRGCSKPECYDENHNPIPGRLYPECNGLKFDYREWHLTSDGITLEELPEAALPMHEPLPYSIWRLTPSERDYIFHRRLPDHLPPTTLGAFTNAESLRRVIIPESVKTIGGNSFQNTALKRVRIAVDCTYNTETTFPVGCKVNFYPDSNCAQLYDSSGKAVLDRNAARIFVKRSEENG